MLTQRGPNPERSESLKHILNPSTPDLMAIVFAFRGPAAFGRLLLMLAAISLLTTPLTQHIWTWDHFLRGGQDFETGTLTIVIILCLAVLLSQTCKRRIDLLFVVRSILAFTFSHGELPGIPLLGALFTSHLEPVNGAEIDRYSLQLKI